MSLLPRTDLLYLTIGTGITTFRAQAVFSGASPTQVVLAMEDGRNFLGDYQRSLSFSTFQFERNMVYEKWS